MHNTLTLMRFTWRDMLRSKTDWLGAFFLALLLYLVYMADVDIARGTGLNPEKVQQWITFAKWNLFFVIFFLGALFSWASEAQDGASERVEDLLLLETGRVNYFASKFGAYLSYSLTRLLGLNVVVIGYILLTQDKPLPLAQIFAGLIFSLPAMIFLAMLGMILYIRGTRFSGLLPFFLYMIFLITGTNSILGFFVTNRTLRHIITTISPSVFTYQVDFTHFLAHGTWPDGTWANLLNLAVWSVLLGYLTWRMATRFECRK